MKSNTGQCEAKGCTKTLTIDTDSGYARVYDEQGNPARWHELGGYVCSDACDRSVRNEFKPEENDLTNC